MVGGLKRVVWKEGESLEDVGGCFRSAGPAQQLGWRGYKLWGEKEQDGWVGKAGEMGTSSWLRRRGWKWEVWGCGRGSKEGEGVR